MAAGAYIAFGALGRGLAWTAADEFSLGRVTTGEGSGARGSRRRLLDLVLGTAVLVGLWAVLIHSLAINPLVAKTPADVWRYLFDGPAAAGSRSLLLHALGETMWLAALGGAIGFALGVVLALAIAAVPSARRVVLSVAIAANTAPIVVLAPIVVILFGHGVAGAAVIVALLVFFPTFVNTLTGLERVSQATLDVLRVYSASSRVVLLKVRVPSAVPLAMGSLLVAVPNAIVGATVAEWLATGNGLGGLMITSGVQVNFAAVWAGAAVLVVATLVALGVAQLIVAVTNRRFT
jgi:ABC-type nitrate/sulfonate/bicarbonate transport system permease component